MALRVKINTKEKAAVSAALSLVQLDIHEYWSHYEVQDVLDAFVLAFSGKTYFPCVITSCLEALDNMCKADHDDMHDEDIEALKFALKYVSKKITEKGLEYRFGSYLEKYTKFLNSQKEQE